MNPLPWFAALCLVPTLLFAASRAPLAGAHSSANPANHLIGQPDDDALGIRVAQHQDEVGGATGDSGWSVATVAGRSS